MSFEVCMGFGMTRLLVMYLLQPHLSEGYNSQDAFFFIFLHANRCLFTRPWSNSPSSSFCAMI